MQYKSSYHGKDVIVYFVESDVIQFEIRLVDIVVTFKLAPQ